MKRVWFPERDLRLTNYAASGMLQEDIGVELGCTTRAVAQRLYFIKERPKVSVTYGEHKLANAVEAKWLDLLSLVEQCKNGGIGVKIDIRENQSSFLAWKSPDGTTSVFDEDTMEVVKHTVECCTPWKGISV